MALWYLAHEDELLIDLDEAGRLAPRSGIPWIEAFFRRRLRDAIEDGKLAVAGVWLDRSTTPKHYHAVVRLAAPMPTIERLIWQLHLGSDLYRGRADLMRAARGFPAPSLFIRSDPIRDFDREPDRECPCTAKHVTSENPACAVWRELRGMSPWELFGRSEPSRGEYGVGLPRGRVPLQAIMRRAYERHDRRNGVRVHGSTEKEHETAGGADRIPLSI